MADPSRPPAPFLPPEIISDVLEFIHPKVEDWSKQGEILPEFASLSRISSGWTIEAQKHLFSAVVIDSEHNLSRLVNGLQSGLGRFILSASLSSNATSSASAQSIFLLLASTPNLRFLSFSSPGFNRFGVIASTAFRTSILLPNLVTLQLNSSSQDYHRQVFELIISSSRLVELEIVSNGIYRGRIWSALPSTLKRLRINGEMRNSILDLGSEGSVWPNFKGLEELEVQNSRGRENVENSLTFFKVVGPTLLKLKVFEAPRIQALPFLVVLQELSMTVKASDPHANVHLSQLPPSLISLTITYISSVYRYSPPLNASVSSHLINLTKLRINNLHASFDLSLFRKLEILELSLEYTQTSLNVVLDSLDFLSDGSSAIKILRLGTIESKEELVRVEPIVDRCEELGIALEQLQPDRNRWEQSTELDYSRYDFRWM